MLPVCTWHGGSRGFVLWPLPTPPPVKKSLSYGGGKFGNLWWEGEGGFLSKDSLSPGQIDHDPPHIIPAKKMHLLYDGEGCWEGWQMTNTGESQHRSLEEGDEGTFSISFAQ